MTVVAQNASVAITAVGPVAGAAWLTPAGAAVDLNVFAKLSVQLGREGRTSIVTLPELPGYNQGCAAREEIEQAPTRRLIVRGHRTQPGRVVLRRGADVLGEVAFSSGVDTVATNLPSTMQTTIGSRRGDDWLVVEGVEGPQARRWCKLPKLGVLVTWDDVDRLLLASRACIVDVSSWTIAFLMHSTRKFLPAMAPRRLTFGVLDLAEPSAPRQIAPAASYPLQQATSISSSAFVAVKEPASPVAPASPSPVGKGLPTPGGTLVDEESSTTSGSTRQVNPDELAKLLASAQTGKLPPLDDGADEGPTKVLPTVDLARLRSETGAAPPPARELPAPSASTEMPEPGEITRAFSALTTDPPKAPSIRTELERRLQAGASLSSLDLRGAGLSGLRARGAKLADVDFSEADLSSADFIGADLTGAKLDGAKLDGAQLDDARLTNASFECATLCGASLRGAMLEGASFAGADLRRADVRAAEPHASLVGANLDGALFS